MEQTLIFRGCDLDILKLNREYYKVSLFMVGLAWILLLMAILGK